MIDGPIVAEFRCASCRPVAMRFDATGPDEPHIRSDGSAAGVDGIRAVAGTLDLWMAASEARGEGTALEDAILAGDAAALMRMGSEIVPFYCRACAATYCEAHSTTWPVFDLDYPGGWFEELRGRCPNGHERSGLPRRGLLKAAAFYVVWYPYIPTDVRRSSMEVSARLSSKGQVTVPRSVREALALEEGDRLVFRVEGDHAILARTADLIALAGSVSVPAAKRATPWGDVLNETRRTRAAKRR